MIKIIFVLISLLLVTIAAPAFAHNPEYANECAKESEQMSNSHEKTVFLKLCLKNINMTNFQLAEKAEYCDQNSKNMKLEGKKKDEYLEHCFFEDDTHPNPNQKPHPK
jgi:hypothetical protein